MLRVYQADEPLGQFLDYCTYGHMIDNVVLIVTGTLHERDVHVRSYSLIG
jgi:V-type H+-transporting ATPase subunit d